MNNKLKLSLLVTMVLGLAACANPGIDSGRGVGGWVRQPIVAGENSNHEIVHTSEACAQNWLGLFATGDASIEKAMKNGRVKTVVYADRNISNFAGLYAKSCTVIGGY